MKLVVCTPFINTMSVYIMGTAVLVHLISKLFKVRTRFTDVFKENNL
ncbi:hypothetical protein THOM_2869 [Trachipleistophora hominis]|uniref:Uncharacterized protein n=1 Tax=Trachipleistophora hominis TaxID=72359 RepID=L7JRY2_TRAHO|nr:hypothetical protein THOM_2869 [Trachipleistophora hominis]